MSRLVELARMPAEERRLLVSALGVVALVRRASRLIPGATCLPQSVAAQQLLQRHGYSSTIRMSAGRELGRFTAHAWLETDRGMLIGDESVAALLPLSRQLVIDD